MQLGVAVSQVLSKLTKNYGAEFCHNCGVTALVQRTDLKQFPPLSKNVWFLGIRPRWPFWVISGHKLNSLQPTDSSTLNAESS